ncbi:Adhesion G-protein coupled receptor G7 [Microtus ochrogaster]|uniref:Adhesion G-protein coupled receptor G7 n=1 Tax=Microtus ochrogaster TaxID=79684 RepID=A0A8J6GDD6_MICOH|nr:Adhesion G-protein coupled receptor G7 [Microtus ochrogaster]
MPVPWDNPQEQLGDAGTMGQPPRTAAAVEWSQPKLSLSASVPSTPVQFCRNGGTWQNSRCICTEEWTGLRCTIESQWADMELLWKYVVRTLQMIDNITTESTAISSEAQILTANADILTPENITSATRVVGQIFNESRRAEQQAKRVAITTVSQLLDASEDVFQKAAVIDNEDSFSTLIEQMESYSFSLGDETIVEPNIAVQSVTRGDDAGSSVLFSVQKGSSGSLVSGGTSINKTADRLNPNGQTELQILLKTGKNTCPAVIKCQVDLMEAFVGTAILTDVLGQTFKKDYQYPESLDILSNIGCALSIAGLALTIIFQIVTRKIRKTSVTWVLVSLCTSMLIFNLLFVFGIENSNKNLVISEAGTTSNNNPDNNEIPARDTVDTPNPSCTAVAAFLHYFLLVTFTWNGLSATQLYFLLIRTMKPLPPHFIAIISLVGWGVPAIVVGVTVGIIYAQSGDKSHWELDYRQEEICWLAIPESGNFVKSPFLWSFIIPVTIILITNIVIFIIITVKVLWKNNQNLTSTKKVSSLKKVLSTLSIAVVFGVTWIFAYAMLINDDNIRIVFSYIFCLFNTTQGLQIFILYTVRTKVFQSEASKVMKSLSSSFDRVKPSDSWIPLGLRVRMYNMLRSIPSLNERFRLLDPSVVSEETSLS